MQVLLEEVFQFKQTESEVSQRNIQQLLHQKLSAIEKSALEQRKIDDPSKNTSDSPKIEGRLGPLHAGLHKQSACGQVKYSQNDLEIESHSNFCSIRGNVCLFKGKWMYEVVLGTSGIQQIGWTQLDSPFTNEEGVGDSPDSYAYDGKRIKKWSVQPQNYGAQWVTGDVISCCIDLDQGQMHFCRNGVSLGTAFSNIKVGERGIGLSYFPGLSLSHGERALINFGAKPFMHPVEGYQPIHIIDYDLHVAASQVQYLLQSLKRLLLIHTQFKNHKTAEVRCKSSDLVSIGANILSFLIPLVTREYILESAFYPFLIDLFENGGNSDGSPLVLFLNLLLATVSDRDLQDVCGQLFEVLSLRHRTTSYTAFISASKANTKGSSSVLMDLQVVLTLLKIPSVFRIFIAHPNFSELLEKFFIRKPLSKDDLTSIIPQVWWQNAEEEGCSKEAMDESVAAVTKITEIHESIVYELFCLFALSKTSVPVINNRGEHSVVPVQNVFRQWLRNLVKKNKAANRNIVPPGLSDSSAMINLFFCLVKYLSPNQENSNNVAAKLVPQMFPPVMFCDDRIIEYFDFPRVGGLLGHLQKTFPIQTPSEPAQIPFEAEIFDDLTFFYHLIISLAFKNASAVIQSLNSAITQLEDTNKRIKKAQELNQSEGVEHLTTAKKVFKDDACDLTRQATWNRQVLFSRWKQEGMFQLMALTIDVLEFFSREQPPADIVFHYIPESYIDTFIDMFHALRRGDPPFSFVASDARMQVLCKVINTLSAHFVDKRIINPDIKDLMLQSLSVLLQYQEFVRVFESPFIEKEKFIENLLLSFDARFWIPISNILLRFWKDAGFAQVLKPNEQQIVSKEYRRVFHQVCSKNQSLLNDWLNKVFNNLNWAITEFGVAAKELQAALPRHIAPELQQHQRKVNVMFELSVTLAKLLEFVSLEMPETFLNPSAGQELNINRLAELLLFILNRCTVGAEAKLFQDLLKVNMIALDKVNRASILAPVVGTIVNLQESIKQQECKYKLAPVIVSTGFNKDTFEFLLTVDWNPKGIPESSPELDVRAKLEILKEFIAELQAESSKADDKQSLTRSDSSDFCSICCSAPVDTRFEPCHHRSCYKCIKRHLLNNKKCFFCNTPITNIILESNNNAQEMVE